MENDSKSDNIVIGPWAGSTKKSKNDNKWVINGVFYPLLTKNDIIIPFEPKILWIKPLNQKKIELDIYCTNKIISHENKNDNALYVGDCNYECSESFFMLSLR